MLSSHIRSIGAKVGGGGDAKDRVQGCDSDLTDSVRHESVV
jgi:hypothetical protein